MNKTEWIIIISAIIIILLIIGFLVWWFIFRVSTPPIPHPSPPSPPTPAGALALLTASPGTQILDSFPYLASGVNPFTDSSKYPQNYVTNVLMIQSPPYVALMNDNISSSIVDPNPDSSRTQYLAYFTAVYPLIPKSIIQKLTTEQLQGWYRSIIFYYITTSNSQPDGGWYGDYWNQRQLDNFTHDTSTGCTYATATHNDSMLFDGVWGNIDGDRTDSWGNHIFLQNMQSSLRKGMRNSPQVLAEKPPWGATSSQYGSGGFPSNVYLEMLMFPIEHPNSAISKYQYGMGFPTGCEAVDMWDQSLAWCPSTSGGKGYKQYPCDGTSKADSTTPLMQPTSPSGMPYATEKPQWFYFSQGNGMFWNMGLTSYCYNYVDFFLNAPMGKLKGTWPIGWSNMYGSGGMLGYTINGDAKEHDYTDPIYSLKLILEFLSRSAYPEACTSGDVSKSAEIDPNTSLPGLGFCASPCTGTNCSMSGASIFTSHSLDKQVAALMGVDSYWYDYNPSGEKNPTASAWLESVVPESESPVYPSRTLSDKKGYDNRYLITGWVNGHFYGFPKGNCICNTASSCSEYQGGVISQGPGSFQNSGIVDNCDDLQCNAFRGGIPGTDPKTGDIIYGKISIQNDPLIYYDQNGKEIYTTWYGKELNMDEETALTLVAEMYSCGDTGWENTGGTNDPDEWGNWPFGSYFSFGQDLGGPGKDLAIQMSQPGYSCTTIQFTAAPTSYESGKVQPAYDFEIQWNPIAVGSTGPATAISCVTLDITADFDGKEQDSGTDLRLYCNQNKGSLGGYVPVNSPAGKSAQAFSGSQLQVTNWTTLNPTAFESGQPNYMNPSVTNDLTWSK